MKNFLIVFLALLVGAVGGYFGWRYYVNWASTTGHSQKTITAENYQEPFMWGATLRPNALGKYSDEIWVKHLKVAQDLGIGWVRIGYDHNVDLSYHDNQFKYIKQKGFDIYLVIEPQGDFEKVKNPYKDGLEKCSPIAAHFKDTIKYYQVMNEAGSNAIKGEQYSGENEADYDQAKYERTRDWIKGCSEGIQKQDPNAYRVVTSQWLQTAFFKKLQDDGVNYDIIGWDWFSDMGFMGDKKLSDGTLLIDKLKSFDKPLILAECNQRPEGENGQEGQPLTLQANFIEKMANWAYENDLKGFYVLELLDVPNSGKGYIDYYGLVRVKKSPTGAYIPAEPRPAFEVYKKIIAQYSQ